MRPQQRAPVDIDAIRQAVVAEISAVAPETDPRALRADRPLREQVDLDSIDWLNVIGALQERLSIDIPAADQGRLVSLDALVAYLAARSAEASTRPAPAAVGMPALAASRHLVDGKAVCVRPIGPADLAREAEFVRHLSAETRYKRFLVTVSELSDAKLHYFTEVDQVRHVALAATVQREGREAIVGVARYIVEPAGSGCEFAIAVGDDWQGSGLAGILMHALLGIARERGLSRIEGTVLATNRRMLKFTRQLGFSQQRDPQDRDTVRVVRAP